MNDRPELVFVLGPPKCATTSLHTWLAHHGEIQASTPKETYYFVDRDHPFFARRGTSFVDDGFDGFERFFDQPADGRVRLESTTHHFASTTCRDFVHSEVCDVAMVMVVRDPAERIRSAFEYSKHNRERIPETFSFHEFVRALADGRDDVISANVTDASTAWALSRSLLTSDYGRWAEFWHDDIERGTLVFVDFDDLTRRTGHVLAALARRWGLSTDPFVGYEPPAMNATTRPSTVRRRFRPRLRGRTRTNDAARNDTTDVGDAADTAAALAQLRALLPEPNAAVRASMLDLDAT